MGAKLVCLHGDKRRSFFSLHPFHRLTIWEKYSVSAYSHLVKHARHSERRIENGDSYIQDTFIDEFFNRFRALFLYTGEESLMKENDRWQSLNAKNNV